MLKIGQEQLDTLNERNRRSFETRMRCHLYRFFPQHCEVLGAEKVDAAIEFAIKRAALYDIESEHGVCIYADLMFAFGHLFDVDGAHPWATAVLRDSSIHNVEDRVERLHQAALTAVADGNTANTLR